MKPVGMAPARRTPPAISQHTPPAIPQPGRMPQLSQLPARSGGVCWGGMGGSSTGNGSPSKMPRSALSAQGPLPGGQPMSGAPASLHGVTPSPYRMMHSAPSSAMSGGSGMMPPHPGIGITALDHHQPIMAQSGLPAQGPPPGGLPRLGANAPPAGVMPSPYRERTVDDALAYLNQIKMKFEKQPHIHNQVRPRPSPSPALPAARLLALPTPSAAAARGSPALRRLAQVRLPRPTCRLSTNRCAGRAKTPTHVLSHSLLLRSS
jgi:hypothetical protein